jgi:hypothetical protein
MPNQGTERQAKQLRACRPCCCATVEGFHGVSVASTRREAPGKAEKGDLLTRSSWFFLKHEGMLSSFTTSQGKRPLDSVQLAVLKGDNREVDSVKGISRLPNSFAGRVMTTSRSRQSSA